MSLAKGSKKSTLSISEGVKQPPAINPGLRAKVHGKVREPKPSGYYISGILAGNRAILSQAITVIESSNPDHSEISWKIIEACLKHSSDSIRIGISGVPGAGKSTFIDVFGKTIIEAGRKVAVLAVDPSSVKSKGSILGDKTRMPLLSVEENAFIRPSPSAGTLGGVARKTRESIILCEAAGFDTIIVETVGVGQSEISAASMVDFFLLLMIPGAGDELQGIKRGIMELADMIAVNKADGENIRQAELAATEFRNAIHLFPPTLSGWIPKVLTCSARENRSINLIWKEICDYETLTKRNGYFESRRKDQDFAAMDDTIKGMLMNSIFGSQEINALRKELETQLRKGKVTAYMAAEILLEKYFKTKGK